MRITLFTSDFTPNIGGVAAHVHELAKALATLDHQVVVLFTVQDGSPAYQLEMDGFKLYRLPFASHPLPPVRIARLRAFAATVQAVIEQERTQILHWHTIRPEGLVSRFVGRQGLVKILTNHTSGYLHMVQSRRGRLLARLHLGHAAQVIAPSEELARKSTFLHVPTERIHFIPNGVDVNRFHPGVPDADLRRRFGFAPNEQVILCPRRIVPKNGVRFLAAAMPTIVEVQPNARLLIVGNGEPDEEACVHNVLHRAGILDRIVFAGAIPNREMPAIYRLADVAVLPSLMEAVSIAGLEAMATGLPLVGTRVGGIPTLIADGETGTLVPPRDPPALAEAILLLLRDEYLRTKMGRASRNRVESLFAWESIAKRTVKVYELCRSP